NLRLFQLDDQTGAVAIPSKFGNPEGSASGSGTPSPPTIVNGNVAARCDRTSLISDFHSAPRLQRPFMPRRKCDGARWVHNPASENLRAENCTTSQNRLGVDEPDA